MRNELQNYKYNIGKINDCVPEKRQKLQEDSEKEWLADTLFNNFIKSHICPHFEF